MVGMKDLSFEQLIIWCCAADESLLRNKVKEVLLQHNFSYVEDDYVSYRNQLDDKYHVSANNLLFSRGNAKYCLVAHTDVCRDHAAIEYKKERVTPNPVVKELDGVKIIQDEKCEVQVGGDDRLGVAIALWIALHTEHDMSILFTTDEEVGLCSAHYVKFEQLKNFDLLIQIDRGNNINQIVTEIHKLQICDAEMMHFISDLFQKNNIKREFVKGFGTDVYAIKKKNFCKNAINMTCGYHDSKYDSGEEYINVSEALEAIKVVVSFLESGK